LLLIYPSQGEPVLLEQNRPGVSENGGTANLVPGKNNRPRAGMGRPSIATALP
jgi:hypothetical protein